MSHDELKTPSVHFVDFVNSVRAHVAPELQMHYFATYAKECIFKAQDMLHDFRSLEEVGDDLPDSMDKRLSKLRADLEELDREYRLMARRRRP